MTDEKKTVKEPDTTKSGTGDVAVEKTDSPPKTDNGSETPSVSTESANKHGKAETAGSKPVQAKPEPPKSSPSKPGPSKTKETPTGKAESSSSKQKPAQTEDASELDLVMQGGGQPPPPPVAAGKPTSPSSGGKAIAMIALLLVLLLAGAVAFAGWWLWERQQSLESAQADQASSADLIELRDSTLSRVERMAGRVDNLATEHQGQVRQLASAEEAVAAVRREQTQVNQRMQRLQELAAATRDDWVLSEVDYLFRVARYRVDFHRDLDGGIAALREADSLLARLGPNTADQRRTIRGAVDALIDVRPADRSDISAQLGQLMQDVDNWRIAVPETRIQAQPMAGQPDADLTSTEGWRQAADRAWQQLKTSLASLIVVRRDDPAPPLISPEESWYVRENIRLQLQTARIAVLEGESETFRDSLELANNWLSRHFRSDDSNVQQARAALERLQGVDIDPDRPDLSKLLPRIDSQREGGS